MDSQAFFNILSNKDVIKKLSEALGPIIQLTISEVITLFSTKFDSSVDALTQSIELLKMEVNKRSAMIDKLKNNNTELVGKLTFGFLLKPNNIVNFKIS